MWFYIKKYDALAKNKEENSLLKEVLFRLMLLDV